MTDQDETQGDRTITSEIGSSLASVWAKHTGERPAGAEVAISGNVVRWELKTGSALYDEDAETVTESDPATPALTMAGYRRDAAAAVARATGRRVMAQMTEHDKKTDGATEVFILDTRAPGVPQQLYRSS